MSDRFPIRTYAMKAQDNDLSDEAFWKWCKSTNQFPVVLAGWQECRRRAEARDEMYEKEITSRDEEIEHLHKLIEERERKAYKAACKTCAFLWNGDADEEYMEQAWLVYKKQQD